MTETDLLDRQALSLRPDASRVVLRPFRPSPEPRDLQPTDKKRANHIVERILALDENVASAELARVLEGFDGRHANLTQRLSARADEMERAFAGHAAFTSDQRLLVGSYFFQEYSYEATALFNPSIVPHPDQSGAPTGHLRIILSLRAVGEGHVSSITFRAGLIAPDGQISIEPLSPHAELPNASLSYERTGGERAYLTFDADRDLSERVIFPVTSSQTNGIEDARFVAFEHDDMRTYYATYTAYDGRSIGSELIETQDFRTFQMTPLRGDAAHNKGMALFPRKINGRYAMIGRQDNENLHLIYSDDLYTWNGGEPIMGPAFPWEFVQMGNCGSPIELDEGWLLLTHGVGPMRKYAVGAALLDKTNPKKVLGRSRVPLIIAMPSEREGYVPNVVYTCGAIFHNDRLVVPYGIADTSTNFSSAPIRVVLDSLTG